MEKLLVCILVYNRRVNIERLLTCWKACAKHPEHQTELVVIHNCDHPPDNEESRGMKAIVNRICPTTAMYVYRPNIGYDAGALQDTVKNRLGVILPEWDLLHWMVDDVVPMQTDFLGPFLTAMQSQHVGVCGIEISTEVRRHLRTNSYMMHRKVLNSLRWPADPMTSKTHSYNFEHNFEQAVPSISLLDQVQGMGLAVQQVREQHYDLMWDHHHRANLNLWEKHFQVFPDSRHLPLPVN